MLILSSLVKFVIYCIIIYYAIDFLTINKLDLQSRTLIKVVLIIPYLFMDSLSNYTEIPPTSGTLITNNQIQTKEKFSTIISNNQPEIKLSNNEKVTNKKIDQELKKKKSVKKYNRNKKKIETFDNYPPKQEEQEL